MLTHTKFQGVDTKNNLSVYPIEDFQHWSKISKTKTDANCMQKFCPGHPETLTSWKKYEKKKTIRAMTKLFVLHVKTKTELLGLYIVSYDLIVNFVEKFLRSKV